jgi:hypothetical protein
MSDQSINTEPGYNRWCPPRGLFAWLRQKWRQATCPHTHVAALYPESATWGTRSRTGSHNTLVLCGCYRCGAAFLRDYGA